MSQTLVMELRYKSQEGRREPYSGLVDGINDVVHCIAHRFGLDILSLSHVVDVQRNATTAITCTAVCLLNGETLQHIASVLSAESYEDNANLYCFDDGFKLSVRVNEICYN